MSIDGELFGSPDQIAVMRRAASLWTLLQNDPRYSYYGRMVSLVASETDALDRVTALTRLQGISSWQYLPSYHATSAGVALEACKIRSTRYELLRGTDAAIAASRALLAAQPMPEDLTVTTVVPATPPEQVAEIAALSLACGVMPVPGAVMRGLSRDGVCLFAIDRSGRVVATASSYVSNHPASSYATDVFWGMLATREDRRGERIGLLLGAQAIVTMAARYGARGFITGVRAANAASNALCRKLCVTPSGWVFLGCIDPDSFGAELITS